jgi:hypothetical protein
MQAALHAPQALLRRPEIPGPGCHAATRKLPAKASKVTALMPICPREEEAREDGHPKKLRKIGIKAVFYPYLWP